MAEATAHSPIGASSMDRWLACPGSIRECRGKENRSSKFAEEGTHGHTLASANLMVEKSTRKADALLELENVKRQMSKYEDMEEAVAVYVDYVLKLKSQTAHPDDIFLVEHSFDLKELHPGLFGTADCVIYQAGYKRLHVIDYKHGAGVPVDVIEDGKANLQLSYYGIGALQTLKLPVAEVVLTIVQPRCFHPDGSIRSTTLRPIEMLEFSGDLIDAAKATEDPNAPLNPGAHCRWCPASATCPALAKRANELAVIEFSKELSYDPEVLAKTLMGLDTLEAYASSVRAFAYAEAEAGRIPPGFKLVDKRASRKWNGDEGDIWRQLLAEAKDIKSSDLFTEPELKSPAQIEKVLGKKQFKELAEKHVVAISSGRTLVPDSDPRAASSARDVTAAFEAFPEITTATPNNLFSE